MEKAYESKYKKIDAQLVYDNPCIVEQILPYQTSQKSITDGDPNYEGTSKHTRTIEMQTDWTKMRNKTIQVKLQKESTLEKFINSIRRDEKNAYFTQVCILSKS